MMIKRGLKWLTVLCMTIGMFFIGEYEVHADGEIPSTIKAEVTVTKEGGNVTNVSTIRVYPSGDMTDPTISQQWNSFMSAFNSGTTGCQIVFNETGQNPITFSLNGKVSVDANGDRRITVDESWKSYFDGTFTVNIIIPSYSNELNVQINEEGGGSPSSKACSLTVVPIEGGTYRYIASCQGEAFAPRSVNTEYNMTLKNDETQDEIHLDKVQGLRFESEDRALIFTTAVTASAGRYIKAGKYSVKLEYENNSYKLSNGGSDFATVNYIAPQLYAESIHIDNAEGNGVKVYCVGNNTETDACRVYLQYIVDHQNDGRAPYNQSYANMANSGFEIHVASGGRPYYFRDVNGRPETAPNTFTDPVFNEGKWSLLIPESEMLSEGLLASDKDYVITANAPGGYEQKKEFATIKIKAKGKTPPAMTTSYDSKTNSILLTTNNEAYLKGIAEAQFTGPDTHVGPQGGIVRYGDDYTVTSNGNGTFTASLPLASVDSHVRYVGDTIDSIIVKGGDYEANTGTFTPGIQNPYKKMPNNVQMKVIGEGVLVRLLQESEAPGAIEEIYNTLANSTNLSRLYPSTRVNGMLNTDRGSDDDFKMVKGSAKCTYKLIQNNTAILVSAKTDDLIVEGRTSVSTEFHLQLMDPLYGTTNPDSAVQTLAPMKLYEEAQKGNTINRSVQDLENLDAVTGSVKNVKISLNETNNGTGVHVVGAGAAAVASNSNGIADPKDLDDISATPKQISVSTTITALEQDGKKMDEINSYMEKNSLTPVGKQFEIAVEKDNSQITGEDAYKVKNLPYEAAVTIPLSDVEVPSGYHLVAIREHKENSKNPIEEIDFETGEDNIGVAYTDEFSTFALAIKKDDVKPTPASSKSSTPIKKDNVVTCQMAGYPANYAWNEAAKACQPGYLDASGAFRSTAGVKKVGVPNTYDKGLKGNVISLAVSTVFAFFAAFMLKKYR